MPLADHVGAVAVPEQHLRQKPVLERDQAVVAGIAGRHLGDARHPVAVMVAPGDHSAVVCMLLYRSPRSASRSRFGVAIGLPKQPKWPKPVSSSTMNSTF